MKIKAIVRYTDCEDEDNCLVLGFGDHFATCLMEGGKLRSMDLSCVTVIDTNYLDLFKENNNEREKNTHLLHKQD